MKNIQGVRAAFGVLEREENVESAVMRLAKNEESGPYGNEHPASVQVLFVVSGEIEATVGGEASHMKAGDSIIVARGVAHRFVGASDEAAVTFNVYSPPAY